MNIFAFRQAAKYLQSSLQVMRSTFVHSFHMVVPTVFEVLLFVGALFHTDWTMREKRLNRHRTCKAGTQVAMADSLVFTVWKQLLLKSRIGTSINYLQPYMVLNRHTLMYEILTYCDDGYAPTSQSGDLECAPRAVHTQPGIALAQ